MKLLVITFTTPDGKNNPGLLHLIASLKHFGYDYEVLVSDKFSWGGDNYKVIAEWLKENRKDYTHILYTDAWDTLAFEKWNYHPLNNLIYSDRWIFSGEKNPCFAIDKSLYSQEERWRYICAGNYICPIDLYIKTIEREKREENENDQQYASRLFETRAYSNIKIDMGCQTFQTLYNMNGLRQPPNWGEFAINDQYEFVNLITGTKPIFVHGNGKVDMRSIYHHPYKNYK